MDQQALIDLVSAAVATALFTWVLSTVRSHTTDEIFRTANGLMATGLVVVASLIWKTNILKWLLGASPTYLPAVLVVLAVVSIQAATRPLETIEEPRIGRLGRRAISQLPVAPEWTDRLLACSYVIASDHFQLSAERVITTVRHYDREGDDLHSGYSVSVELVFWQKGDRNLTFGVEVAPFAQPTTDRPKRRASFSSEATGDGRMKPYPILTFHPLLLTHEMIPNQVRDVQLRVEVSDATGLDYLVSFSRDDTALDATKRQFVFDCRLRGPKARLRVSLDGLLHTKLLPVLYFQPQVLVLKEWELNVETSDGITLQYPTVIATQLPAEGVVEFSPQRMQVSHKGGLATIDGQRTDVPVMPWTSVLYGLANPHVPAKQPAPKLHA